MTILVTGANGFIGRHFCTHATRAGVAVVAMLRRPDQLNALQQFVTDNGGTPSLISAIHGDLDAPALGITSSLPHLDAIVHLGARFAWGMDDDDARCTNRDGALAVAELARTQPCRLIMVSGFMLENHQHLQRLGIDPNAIDTDSIRSIDWSRIYARVGAYEASKLEGALRVRAFCREHHVDMVEVQPATVAGHSHSGHLDASQPLFNLIDNVNAGRMALVPGTPAHWLPLVAVDHLVAIMFAACTADSPPAALLALDPDTPSLIGLLSLIAVERGRKPPRHHLPLPALKLLLRIPGMQTLMHTSIEALDFIQTTRFDVSITDEFIHSQNIARPNIHDVIRLSARDSFHQHRVR